MDQQGTVFDPMVVAENTAKRYRRTAGEEYEDYRQEAAIAALMAYRKVPSVDFAYKAALNALSNCARNRMRHSAGGGRAWPTGLSRALGHVESFDLHVEKRLTADRLVSSFYAGLVKSAPQDWLPVAQEVLEPDTASKRLAITAERRGARYNTALVTSVGEVLGMPRSRVRLTIDCLCRRAREEAQGRGL